MNIVLNNKNVSIPLAQKYEAGNENLYAVVAVTAELQNKLQMIVFPKCYYCPFLLVVNAVIAKLINTFSRLECVTL